MRENVSNFNKTKRQLNFIAIVYLKHTCATCSARLIFVSTEWNADAKKTSFFFGSKIFTIHIHIHKFMRTTETSSYTAD